MLWGPKMGQGQAGLIPSMGHPWGLVLGVLPLLPHPVSPQSLSSSHSESPGGTWQFRGATSPRWDICATAVLRGDRLVRPN